MSASQIANLRILRLTIEYHLSVRDREAVKVAKRNLNATIISYLNEA